MKQFVQQAAKEAGQVALNFLQKDLKVQEKTGANDLVTAADKAVHQFLIEQIQQAYPEHGIHSEEMADDINSDAEFLWVLDPIDGTWCFVHGVPLWCVMIAVLQHGTPIMSAVYNPVTDQLFFAEKGQGAWLNDARLAVADRGAFAQTMMHVDIHPEWPDYDRIVACDRALHAVGARTFNMYSMLAACYTASGAFHGYVANCGHNHDFFPVIPIAAEAGAIVTDFDGKPWTAGTKNIVIAPPTLHTKLLDFLHT